MDQNVQRPSCFFFFRYEISNLFDVIFSYCPVENTREPFAWHVAQTIIIVDILHIHYISEMSE